MRRQYCISFDGFHDLVSHFLPPAMIRLAQGCKSDNALMLSYFCTSPGKLVKWLGLDQRQCPKDFGLNILLSVCY